MARTICGHKQGRFQRRSREPAERGLNNHYAKHPPLGLAVPPSVSAEAESEGVILKTGRSASTLSNSRATTTASFRLGATLCAAGAAGAAPSGARGRGWRLLGVGGWLHHGHCLLPLLPSQHAYMAYGGAAKSLWTSRPPGRCIGGIGWNGGNRTQSLGNDEREIR